MKTIGLIGGMSWESSTHYYEIINRTVARELGGHHSAQCLMYSVDFQPVVECQQAGRWEEAGEVLADAARRLEGAGADYIVICTNTMHKVAGQVENAVNIPLLHIAEVTADALLAAGIKKVGLTGTKYTMKEEFYKERLIRRGIEVVVPDETVMDRLNAIIFDELCLGEIKDTSRRYFVEEIEKLAAQGCTGVILGCTEIGMLVKQADTKTPLFDTTELHARATAMLAVRY